MRVPGHGEAQQGRCADPYGVVDTVGQRGAALVEQPDVGVHRTGGMGEVAGLGGGGPQTQNQQRVRGGEQVGRADDGRRVGERRGQVAEVVDLGLDQLLVGVRRGGGRPGPAVAISRRWRRRAG